MLKRLVEAWRNRHMHEYVPQYTERGIFDDWGECGCGATVEYEKAWENY